MFDDRVNAPATRWISVIFLQGEEADELFDLIDHRGPFAAIEHLQHWDYGDETVDAALMNGYVYDHIPAGSTDRTIEELDSPYALTYSASFGYVSLLRRYTADPELELVSVPRTSATHRARGRHDVADTWASTRVGSANNTGHAVAL
ncbi:hypothetical protein ASC66_11235 [Leifsonia sp. Root4]|uniref:hypothetical protein n=1 Tax=Leifsonia sp. Root4 TaxID=1736525 RepID=UPI0006FC4E4C|nr:hypothetical protein [Leifsonia sp. Root4]KQW05556.1 hypothetical protein ASC66_11235 [Leifsonia sp. Root4]